jgi:hypothetical protein
VDCVCPDRKSSCGACSWSRWGRRNRCEPAGKDAVGVRRARHSSWEFLEAVQGVDDVGLAGLILQEGAGESSARKLWRSSCQRGSGEGEDGSNSEDEEKRRLSAADAAGLSVAERFREAYIWQRERQRVREQRLAAAEVKKALKSSAALRAMNQWLDDE